MDQHLQLKTPRCTAGHSTIPTTPPYLTLAHIMRLYEQSLLGYSCSNDPLPDTLVSAWANCLDTLTESISVQDQRILVLESELESLRKQRLKDCEKRNFIASFRSPVRRLPGEMIAHIMRFALDLHRRPLDQAGRVQFVALRSVCSLWRRTALTTPDLWQRLELDLTGRLPHSIRANLAAAMSSWFCRGGTGSNMELTIKDKKRIRGGQWDNVAQILDHSPFSFTRLRLGPGILVDTRCLSSFLLPSTPKASLKSLSIYLPAKTSILSDNDNDDNDEHQNSLTMDHLRLENVFPQLDSLTLSGTIQSSVSFSHPSLRAISLDNGNLSFCWFYNLTNRFPLLEELTITNSADMTGVGIHTYLPSLKRLTLVGPRLPWLITQITCPNLEFVHIVNLNAEHWPARFPGVNVLAALVRGSKAKDVTLRITDRNPGTILWQLLASTLPVHRLHVPDIEWLGPGRPQVSIPISLREIVAWKEPAGGEKGSQSSGHIASTKRTLDIQTINVFVPVGAAVNFVSSASIQECTPVEFKFHHVTEGQIQSILSCKSQTLCHEYEALIENNRFCAEYADTL